MHPWTDYTWIVVCGALAAFFTAYGIGANDVANAFGSSVAARTLTLRQALLIAAVCEFSGSVLLGGQVTRTVAGGIARLSTFERVPEIYMFGMLCALVASGTWLLLATYLELPVSTTHSIIGAVLGFALVYGGVDAVVWLQPTDRFPFMSGMVPIILSWFTSPLLCGLATAALFVVLRSSVLRRENSLQLTYMLLPLLVLITVFVNCFFVLNKGASRELTWSVAKCAWVSAAAAGGCALLTAVTAVPLLRRVVGKEEEKRSRRRQHMYRMASRGVEDAVARGSAGTVGTGGAATRSSSAALKHASRRRSSSAMDHTLADDDFAAGGGGGGGARGDSGTALLAPPPAAVVVANNGHDAGGGAGGWGSQAQQQQQEQQPSPYDPQHAYGDAQAAATAAQLHAVLRHSHSHSHSQVSYQHASMGNSQYGMTTTTGVTDAAGGGMGTTEEERLSHATHYNSSSAGGALVAVPYGAGRSSSLPHPRYLKDSESYGLSNATAPPRGGSGPPAAAHSMRALAVHAPGLGAATGSSTAAVPLLVPRDSADSRGLPSFPRTGSGRLLGTGGAAAAALHAADAVGTDSGTVHASSSSAAAAAVARPGVEDLGSGPAGAQQGATVGEASTAIPSGASGQGHIQQPWLEGSGTATPSGERVISHRDGSQGGVAMTDGVMARGSSGVAVQSGGGGGGGDSGAQTPGVVEAETVTVGGGGAALEEQLSNGRLVHPGGGQGQGQGQGALQPVPAASPQPQAQPQQLPQQLQGQQMQVQAPAWQPQQQQQQGWHMPGQQPQQSWGQQHGWQQQQQQQQQQQGWQQQGWQQPGWQQQQHAQGWQQQQQQPHGWQQQQQQQQQPGWQQRQPQQWQQQAQQWHQSPSQPQQQSARNWTPQQQGWQQGQQQPAFAQQPQQPPQQQWQQQQWQQQQQQYGNSYGNQAGHTGQAANLTGYGQGAVSNAASANPFARQNFTQQQAGPIAEGMNWTRKSLGWMNPSSAYGAGGQEEEHDGMYGAAGDTSAHGKAAAAAAHGGAGYDAGDAESAMESGMGHGGGGLRHSPSGVGGGGGHAANPHWQNTFDQLKAIVLHGTRVNVHEALETDMTAQAIHLAAEVFDPDTEYAFRYLQVITAMCDSFSHGANDVANAVGPFCAIWYIYNNFRIDYQAELPIWILVIGGAGIVVGLGTYGYNIIRAIGMRLSAITPARGFCIELATAVVVVVASNYGLPVSTTHCQVGATAGMGLTEGSTGLNWVLALQFFLGWVVTLLITGVLSAALFAVGAYSPSIIQENAITQYEDTLLQLTAQLDSLLNRTNRAGLSDPATWGAHSAALEAQLQADAAFLGTVSAPGNKKNTRPVQHLDYVKMTGYLNSTISTYLNNSLPYIGGMAAKGIVLPRDRGAT